MLPWVVDNLTNTQVLHRLGGHVDTPSELEGSPAMHDRCGVPDCPAIAEIVVRDPGGGELDACRRHWHEALQRSNGLIRGVRLIRRPACFLSGCANAAVEIIDDSDGLPLPVCEAHRDDLSWVNHPPIDLPRRDPGWSHGL